MSTVLLVDDDREMCELLTEYLLSEGFSVVAVHDGESGVKEALNGNFELILLDITLPKLNGLEVLKKIRKCSEIPILMLTARGSDVDRIIGLEIGADDYLSKPFHHRELIARIKAILRRTQLSQQNHDIVINDKRFLTEGDISINLANHQVQMHGRVLDLTATEFIILKTLIESIGELINRKTLTTLVLNRNLVRHDRAIDMHVSNLRKKLGKHLDGSPRIKTVRGVGYFYVQYTS